MTIGLVNLINIYQNFEAESDSYLASYWVLSCLSVVLLIVSVSNEKLTDASYVSALIILGKMYSQLYEQTSLDKSEMNKSMMTSQSILCIVVLQNIRVYDKINVSLRVVRVLIVAGLFTVFRFIVKNSSVSRNITLVVLMTILFYVFETTIHLAYEKYFIFSDKSRE